MEFTTEADPNDRKGKLKGVALGKMTTGVLCAQLERKKRNPKI